jgi:hypothetical protein
VVQDYKSTPIAAGGDALSILSRTAIVLAFNFSGVRACDWEQLEITPSGGRN